MADTKERLQKDIAEAFDFARFVLRHPGMLGKIKNGAEIQFIPTPSHRMARSAGAAKNIQAFSTETVFRSL